MNKREVVTAKVMNHDTDGDDERSEARLPVQPRRLAAKVSVAFAMNAMTARVVGGRCNAGKETVVAYDDVCMLLAVVCYRYATQ